MRPILLVPLVSVACGGASPAIAPPSRGIDPSPEACARCHPEVVAQWRPSMHARAWSDPVFRAEYERRPAASCRDCHAPASSAPARTTGVDCASCHLENGFVLAAEVSVTGWWAHPMRAVPRLRSATACAGCHQFQFTDDGVHDPGEALQDTMTEYRASESFARGESCQDCHMAEGHGFAGIHDPAQLARAVDVDVRARRDAGTIAVVVRVRGASIGHAFPTGDVFRSAVLEIGGEHGASERIAMQRWLARTADADNLGFHVRTVDDTRVPPPGRGELSETIEFPDDGSAHITWNLVLHRLPPERARASGLSAAQAERLVAHGSVAVQPAEAGARPARSHHSAQ